MAEWKKMTKEDERRNRGNPRSSPALPPRARLLFAHERIGQTPALSRALSVSPSIPLLFFLAMFCLLFSGDGRGESLMRDSSSFFPLLLPASRCCAILVSLLVFEDKEWQPIKNTPSSSSSFPRCCSTYVGACLQLLLCRYVPACFFFHRQTVVLFSWIISMEISFGEFSLLV